MNLHIFQNKKASLADPIFSGAYILKIALTLLICIFVWISFRAAITPLFVGSSSETLLGQVMADLQSAYFSFDYVFPFLVGGLLIISAIFAYKTGSNVIWGVLSIIIWGIALMISGIFVNVYEQVAAEFPTVTSGMPVMHMIMTHMNTFVLVWLAIISLVMFRKNNVEDDMSETQRRIYGK